jgi:3-deoxy-D-manno-octulosonic-acid transferase
LEAATYGIPVIIGPNYKKFQEAKDLISLGGCTVIHNQQELNAVLDNFLEDSNKRITIGKICSNFILKNKNATEKIFTRIFNLHK